MKKRTNFAATMVAVYLSLNIEVIDDRRGENLWAIPLLSLSWLFLALAPLVSAWRQVEEAAGFWATMLGIGVRSLCWAAF